MAQLIFEIPNEQVFHVHDMLAIHFGGYSETIINENGQEIQNPESKQVFVHKSLAKWASDVVQATEKAQAIIEAHKKEATPISIL